MVVAAVVVPIHLLQEQMAERLPVEQRVLAAKVEMHLVLAGLLALMQTPLDTIEAMAEVAVAVAVTVSVCLRLPEGLADLVPLVS